MTTDTTEKGLDTLIMRHLTGGDCLAGVPGQIAEHTSTCGGTGYFAGAPQAYDRARPLDVRVAATQLSDDFLLAIISDAVDEESPTHEH
jgi:hypothetical protein